MEQKVGEGGKSECSDFISRGEVWEEERRKRKKEEEEKEKRSSYSFLLHKDLVAFKPKATSRNERISSRRSLSHRLERRSPCLSYKR